MLIFCVDGLAGFKEAIEAIYPFARIQICIIHQIRVKYDVYSIQRRTGNGPLVGT